VDYYHETLKGDAEGLAYLEKRGISAEAVDYFKLGLANRTDCYRIHFPKGMDANECACQVKPASKSLGAVIRSAVWLGKGDAQGCANVAEGTTPGVEEVERSRKPEPRMPGATDIPERKAGPENKVKEPALP
jgi:hypothetical protein